MATQGWPDGALRRAAIGCGMRRTYTLNDARWEDASMVNLVTAEDSNVLTVEVTEKLEKADYERFVPRVEFLIEKFGRIRVLFLMRDFHGWSVSALWKDITFDLKHFKDVERVAVVGDKRWEKGMAAFCKPFTTADVKYFDLADLDEARGWVQA